MMMTPQLDPSHPQHLRPPLRPLFTRRALVLIFGLGLSSLLLAAAVMWLTDPRDKVESIDTDTFSKSAIGHMALRELLDDRDVSHQVRRYRSHEKVRGGGALVLAEPHLMRGAQDDKLLKKFREMVARSPRTLLVLPKRDGVRDAHDEEWIGAAFNIPEYDVAHVLQAAGVSARAVRTRRSAEQMMWQSRIQGVALEARPDLPDVQLLLPGPGVEPLIETPYGVLFARVHTSLNAAPLYVLSDPDLIANHGLHREPNAALTLEILHHVAPDGELVIDEVIHGHERIPSLQERLLEFPLVLVTIQAGLLLLFLLWGMTQRFGPPLRAGEARAPGTSFVIDNTAELLTFGGHSAFTTERYVWMVLQELGRTLNAPATLTRPQLVAWLQARADAREVPIALAQLTARAEAYAHGRQEKKVRPIKLLTLAFTIDRFRHQMTQHET